MSIPIRVLIVEDSEDDVLLLVREFCQGGYDPDYEQVETPTDMLAALQHQNWDLIIADHDMSQFGSDAALELLKKSGLDIPFIIISGSIGEEFAVAAMKAGARDYLKKDNLARLVPAVEMELRDAEARRAHRRTQEEIRHMAYHDALTDLVNRREFERRIELALTSVRERGLNHALLYLDLDRFKLINDSCGHMAGDELLQQLALLFQGHVRGNDTLARIGGDEFGVLLESCPLQRAHRIAEELLKEICCFRFVWQGRPFSIGVSIGLVEITSDSQTTADILRAADLACYAAKDMGRNRLHIYRDRGIDLAQQQGDRQWIPRIRQALQENRFLLYRQAIVPLDPNDSNRFGQHNFEFLLRLRDNRGRIIAPGAFIPAAERYNLMPELDRWVIKSAFAYLAKKFRHDPGLMKQGIYFMNLSGTSLSDKSFSTYVLEQLQEYRLPPQSICFELTETAAISNLGKAVEFIKEIRIEGGKFALDDFGSGLSSFSYLKTIPVDFLKIDGGFVRNMLTDPIDYAIVESINQVGHAVGMQTISESVELEEVKYKLRNIGVDYAQGYSIESSVPLEN